MAKPSISDRYLQLSLKLLPSPFSIALVLTGICILLILVINPTIPISISEQLAQPNNPLRILEFWQMGVWELLAFTMQMVLILVLGHSIALSKPFQVLMGGIVRHCNTSANSAAIVGLSSIFLAYLNWGLALIFGALLARAVGKKFAESNQKLNYPLVGAAAYLGLMVWHGGFSGSAPLKVSGTGHFLEAKMGVLSTTETLLSPMNLCVVFATLVLLPMVVYAIGKRRPKSETLLSISSFQPQTKDANALGSNKNDQDNGYLDRSKWFAILIGLFMLFALVVSIDQSSLKGLKFLNLNNINLLLFSLALCFHGSIRNFVSATTQAIKGSAGVILQFPLYAGIMGLMKYSGLLDAMASGFVDLSVYIGHTSDSFPLLTFCSAGLVNVFVPSGGGQWAVQGPIIVEAANNLGVSLPKSIMAMAYGDQLTNMIQPFWALPLLSITGLSARQLLPYTFLLMLCGGLIFTTCILIF